MFYGTKMAQALCSAIQRKGISDADVARAFDVRPPSVSEWKLHGRVHKKHIPKLLSYFQDVVGPEHWGLDVLETCKKGYISLNLLKIKPTINQDMITSERFEVLQQVNVLESWARSALGSDLSRIKLISARGTSMQGTIENGDVLFVDETVKSYDGDGIYVIARGCDVQVKRLQKLHNGVLALISDNRAYEAERLAKEDAESVVICGRVLASWTLRRFW